MEKSPSVPHALFRSKSAAGAMLRAIATGLLGLCVIYAVCSALPRNAIGPTACILSVIAGFLMLMHLIDFAKRL